jgi:hypothetical protein
MKMEATSSSELLVDFQQATQHYIPEDKNSSQPLQWEPQILQVRVPQNKLFKDYMQRFCSEWTAAWLHNLTS